MDSLHPPPPLPKKTVSAEGLLKTHGKVGIWKDIWENK
jgi:hypothetical protein